MEKATGDRESHFEHGPQDQEDDGECGNGVHVEWIGFGPPGGGIEVDEQSRGEGVKDDAMSESTFPIEFIGGSRDGEIVEVTVPPDHFEVHVGGALKEIYERQTNAPPFVYVQIGYAENETWK